MQNNPYIQFLRTWFVLILLGVVVAVIATNYAMADREHLYRATASLQVGRLLDDKDPTQNDLAVIERLIPAYGESARREPVLNAAINELELEMTADALRRLVLVQVVPQTQLIDILVVTSDPELSAAIANEIGRQVVLQSPSASDEGLSADFIASQLNDLQQKIADTQAEAEVIDASIAGLTSAAQVFEAQEERRLLLAQIDVWQQTYASLLASAEPGSANVVRVVTTATPPEFPVATQTSLYYGLAVIAGAGLATLAALALSMMGKNITDAKEIRPLVAAKPVITVPRYPVPQNGVPITLKDPQSPATSAYRILRNSVLLGQQSNGRFSLAVTSTRTGEGKTTTVANLGIALANSGMRVLLVDANLHNPELDQALGVRAGVGFSDLLHGDTTIRAARQPTGHENLWLIGAGLIPEQYADILSSAVLGPLVEELSHAADIVLFDTPAVAQEQESHLLVQHVSGVLIIAESGGVSTTAFESTVASLENAGANVLAVVLNKQRQQRWSVNQLPWSREARLQTRAEAHRKRHMRADQPENVKLEPASVQNSDD